MHVSRREMLRLSGLASASLMGWVAGCGGSGQDTNNSLWLPDTDGMMMPPDMGMMPGDAGTLPKPWWLSGNYGPVPDEIEAFDLMVEGQIPSDLNGIFLRNGANPIHHDSPHWFLGDGMLHGIRFADGKAEWYRNRFIRTPAFEQMQGDSLAANRANTSLVEHAGKVLALYEVGQPFEISPDDLSTIGPYNFEGALQTAMSAHPKIDPVTGEMFFIGYAPFPPYLTLHVVDANESSSERRHIGRWKRLSRSAATTISSSLAALRSAPMRRAPKTNLRRLGSAYWPLKTQHI